MPKKSRIPKGMTEQEVLDVIEEVVSNLAFKYKFGYHSIDDMKQQARMEAWKGLENFDNKRPLPNFLWTHVRNRLFNFKRDNYERPDKPCNHCPFNAYISESDTCTKFDDKMECYLYNGWIQRNNAKRNIMRPIELSDVRDENENNMKTSLDVVDVIEKKEILEILDKHMPINLRTDYIRLLHNIKIPSNKSVKIENEIKRILREYYLHEEEGST